MPDPVTLSAGTSWGVSAAGWLISPVLSQLVNKCFDALGLDPRFQSRKKALDKKLEDLQTTLLPQLLILTDAAQKSPHRRELEAWLQKLKTTYYEAEHLLGLVKYTQLKKEVKSLFPSSPEFNFKLFNKELKNRETNLLKSLKELETVVNEAKEFTKLNNLSARTSSANNSTSRASETISTPVFNVIGRDKDRDQIVELLRKDNSETSSNSKCYSVIGIWGMAGSGKTTLAKFVCEYENKSNYFDYVIWVHFPEKFNLHSIYKRIWESAFDDNCPNCDGIEGLNKKIQKKLSGKRFLLVLDDVCCRKDVSALQLEQLFAPLLGGKRGSKILITTRNAESARTLGATNPIPLRQLEYDEFLDLFMSRALSDLNDMEKQFEGDLKIIGEQIAAKLHRSPLTAMTVATQLRRRVDPEFWLSLLDQKLLNETMGALLLSYQNLSPTLQRCFAFCSLFPKGHKFSEDQLVNLWIGEGFIETERSNRHVRDIGNGYISELISGSFLEVWKNEFNTVYSLHDLMHDLAEKVSNDECFRIEGEEGREIPAQTLHSYVEAYMFEENVRKICKLKNLRTIIIWDLSCNLEESLKGKDLNVLFEGSKKLSVIDLHDTWIDKIPKSLFYLENLRYLINGFVGVQCFHESLTRLYQLHLLRGIFSDHQIPNIGRLTLLQELHGFKARNKTGCGLEQLEHLKDLYGELLIYGLENVKSKEEARRAKLSDKKGLCELSLHWKYKDGSAHIEDVNLPGEHGSPPQIEEAEILDELCPPPQIKKLTIKCYGGKRCPRWFIDYNKITTHLRILQLLDCQFLEALPEMNNLIYLQSLTIKLPMLERWASLPPNLANLTFFCQSLAFGSVEDLSIVMLKLSSIENKIRGGVRYGIRKWYLQVQRELDTTAQRQKVNGELHFPVTLETLHIGTCFITDKVLEKALQGCTGLTNIELSDIITITSIPKEVLSSLTSLRALKILGCLMLTSVSGLETLCSFQNITIEDCPYLRIEMLIVARSCFLKNVNVRRYPPLNDLADLFTQIDDGNPPITRTMDGTK